MNIYCKSCGSPNAYGSKKPKFCSNCGVSLASLQAKAAVSAPKKPVAQETNEDDDFQEENINIPNISRLEADVESGRVKGVKIGEIAGTSDEELEQFNRPKSPETSSEEAIKQLQKEGGSIRRKESS